MGVFRKSIELFPLKFTSSEIIDTEWQRCIDDVLSSQRGRSAALPAEGGGAGWDAGESASGTTAGGATSYKGYFLTVLMGPYEESAIV